MLGQSQAVDSLSQNRMFLKHMSQHIIRVTRLSLLLASPNHDTFASSEPQNIITSKDLSHTLGIPETRTSRFLRQR